MAYKELNKVILMPSCINNVHESCFRSYHILEYVLGMVSREDSKETIIDMAAFLKELPEPENKASNTGNEDYETRSANWRSENLSTKEEVQKDWEVLEIECYGGETRRLVDGLYRVYDEGIGFDFEYLMNRTDSSIKKVKRSDGVVFSVGDMLTDLGFDNHSDKINSIYEINGTIALGYGNGGAVIINYAKKLPIPTEQTKGDVLPQIDEDAFKNRCNVCGGDLVYIRGKYPNTDKRQTCPTCTTERLEQINEISNKDYGKAYQNKN